MVTFTVVGIIADGMGAFLLGLSFFGRKPSDVIREAGWGSFMGLETGPTPEREKQHLRSWLDGLGGSSFLLIGFALQLVGTCYPKADLASKVCGALLTCVWILYLCLRGVIADRLRRRHGRT